PAGGDIRRGQHSAGRDGDGNGAPQRGVRVEKVDQAEQRPGQQERDPRSGPPLDVPEHNTAEDQLLGHGSTHHDPEQSHRTCRRAKALIVYSPKMAMLAITAPNNAMPSSMPRPTPEPAPFNDTSTGT